MEKGKREETGNGHLQLPHAPRPKKAVRIPGFAAGVPLSQISLNIMPHHVPDAATRGMEGGQSAQEFPSREWRRAGKVLATGRWIDYAQQGHCGR
jgi:hypothetical protein